MNDPIIYFLTWTTYGTWLPGDRRGWRKKGKGKLLPQPRLEDWSRKQLIERPVYLTPKLRTAVERKCHDHAEHRGWVLHAISARTNHVHLAVTADRLGKTVRDQFKANATRAIREVDSGFRERTIWTSKGDVEILDSEDDLDSVVLYILEGQDWPEALADADAERRLWIQSTRE